MTKTDTHTTHVAHLPHVGKWQAYCDQCGDIGRAETLDGDAYAIADRHAEVGGFERPHGASDRSACPRCNWKWDGEHDQSACLNCGWPER